eukprot:gnl/TRDRNA2_/TRDRNA2_184121_c0_seq1.p1 gnl/TRDRNA2_/TRDRNA2_184121_c0~~gnl/TRDRNA2_/TRDRNA2_184121_c0_seq1.p1  ORF type:complete len:217 (-),score=45.39 gnl/TRDRNA2_/TRDRNA2_184121_c0_seq1:108-758(-)
MTHHRLRLLFYIPLLYAEANAGGSCEAELDCEGFSLDEVTHMQTRTLKARGPQRAVAPATAPSAAEASGELLVQAIIAGNSYDVDPFAAAAAFMATPEPGSADLMNASVWESPTYRDLKAQRRAEKKAKRAEKKASVSFTHRLVNAEVAVDSSYDMFLGPSLRAWKRTTFMLAQETDLPHSTIIFAIFAGIGLVTVAFVYWMQPSIAEPVAHESAS